MLEKICLANPEDAEKLMQYFRDNDNVQEDFFKKRINYYIDNHFITLVKIEDKIIGCLLFQAKEEPHLGVGEFECVHIHKEYQGRGLGAKMVQKSIDFAKNYFGKKGVNLRCIYLFTRSNNLVAQKVYEKYGFKSENTIGKIFKDNEPDELVMTKFF